MATVVRSLNLSRHRIVPAAAPRVAAEDSPHGQKQSFDRTPLFERLDGIGRTRRLETARLGNMWTDAGAVEPDKRQKRGDAHHPHLLPPKRNVPARLHVPRVFEESLLPAPARRNIPEHLLRCKGKELNILSGGGCPSGFGRLP